MPTINEMNINGTLYDIQDTVSGYLKVTDATNTFLSKTDATNTYLSKTEASSNYTNKWATSSHWYNVNGMSIHKYEGENTSTYKIPTSYCYVLSMTNGGTRGAAIAIDWRGSEQHVWANHLHDDMNQYSWTGWYTVK